jgi:AcrR family transcriptional regulator
MTTLRAAQKRMTRRLLLESALRLFQEKGYSAATIDEIAVGAGATRTTFYLHFASKSELMSALIKDVNDLIVSTDVPRLTEVVRVGDRAMIRAFVERRFEQWPEIMPYVTAGDQAAGTDPEIGALVEAWHESAIDEIVAGLTAANRFEPEQRKLRGVLAFAQLEYLSRRWTRRGWGDGVEREPMLDALTDSLSNLLVVDAASST